MRTFRAKTPGRTSKRGVGKGVAPPSDASATAGIKDGGKVGTATADDVSLAETLPAAPGVIDPSPPSTTALNLLKDPELLAAIVEEGDFFSRLKGGAKLLSDIRSSVETGTRLADGYPRVCVTRARYRQAMVENNNRLESMETFLAGLVDKFDGNSRLGRALAKMAKRRSALRGITKAKRTRNAKRRAKRSGSPK